MKEITGELLYQCFHRATPSAGPFPEWEMLASWQQEIYNRFASLLLEELKWNSKRPPYEEDILKGGNTLRIIETPSFLQEREQLPPNVIAALHRRIALLRERRVHRAMRLHRIERARDGNIWECWLTRQYRLVFRRDGEIIELLAVGDHQVVDRVHTRGY